MNCADARNALLTADPDELRGVGDTAVALHVRTCADCANDARQILAMTSALALELDRMSAPPARKRTAAEAWPVWLALPIAAALAALLVTRDTQPRVPLPRVGNIDEVKQPVVHPVVNAPADRNVAVIEAGNNITVVWDLGAKGGS